MPDRVIVMIGPSPRARGGMATVIDSYFRAGLCTRWPVRFLPTHVEGTAARKLLVATISLLKFCVLLTRGRVALLHAHVPRRRAFWRKSVFMAVAYLARCPYVVHLHSGGFTAFYRDECAEWQRVWVRRVLDRAARIVVLSDQWYRWLEGITRNTRIVRAYNFVALPEVAPPRCGQTLVFLGRLTDEKGFYDLLDAMARVKRIAPDVKLLCGGTGGEARAARRIRELRLEAHVTLLGWVGDDARACLLRESAVFVLPSHAEGVPMGVLEAMAAGMPVIATRVGGIPEMIDHGVEGLLTESGDIDGLADAITTLLRNPERRAAMSAAARKRIARQFTAVAALPPLERIYAELGARPRSG